MKVLHVVRGLTNSSGTTHVVIPLAEEQARQGAQVSVFFVDKRPHESLFPAASLVESQRYAESVRLGHPGVSLSFARAVRNRISDFDVVHVHAVWNFPTWWTMRTALKAGVPYMVAPQGSLAPQAFRGGSWQRRTYARHVERALLARATRLQALTDTEAKQFRRFGLDVPTAVIANGVTPEWLKGRRADLAGRLGLPPGSKTLLFLSRLHQKKGVDILLRAFAEVRDSIPDVVLAVAGSDAGSGYAETLHGLADSLELGGRCLFLGELQGSEKRRAFLGADAFALISHSEGLPVAVLEAMASGLPVLITPGCNLPEVVSSDAGLMVAPSVEATASGLREMFSDTGRQREWGENGRRLVRDRFTWPPIAQRALAVYREMIGEVDQAAA